MINSDRDQSSIFMRLLKQSKGTGLSIFYLCIKTLETDTGIRSCELPIGKREGRKFRKEYVSGFP
jgi:hypothetical protein